jgi:hypothetical protein
VSALWGTQLQLRTIVEALPRLTAYNAGG